MVTFALHDCDCFLKSDSVLIRTRDSVVRVGWRDSDVLFWWIFLLKIGRVKFIYFNGLIVINRFSRFRDLPCTWKLLTKQLSLSVAGSPANALRGRFLPEPGPRESVASFFVPRPGWNFRCKTCAGCVHTLCKKKGAPKRPVSACWETCLEREARAGVVEAAVEAHR